MMRIAVTGMAIVARTGTIAKKSFPFRPHEWLVHRNTSVSSFLLNIAANDTTANKKSVWGSNKKTRQVKLNFPLDTSDPIINQILSPLRAAVKEQVRLISIIRRLDNWLVSCFRGTSCAGWRQAMLQNWTLKMRWMTSNRRKNYWRRRNMNWRRL